MDNKYVTRGVMNKELPQIPQIKSEKNFYENFKEGYNKFRRNQKPQKLTESKSSLTKLINNAHSQILKGELFTDNPKKQITKNSNNKIISLSTKRKVSDSDSISSLIISNSIVSSNSKNENKFYTKIPKLKLAPVQEISRDGINLKDKDNSGNNLEQSSERLKYNVEFSNKFLKKISNISKGNISFLQEKENFSLIKNNYDQSNNTSLHDFHELNLHPIGDASLNELREINELKLNFNVHSSRDPGPSCNLLPPSQNLKNPQNFQYFHNKNSHSLTSKEFQPMLNNLRKINNINNNLKQKLNRSEGVESLGKNFSSVHSNLNISYVKNLPTTTQSYYKNKMLGLNSKLKSFTNVSNIYDKKEIILTENSLQQNEKNLISNNDTKNFKDQLLNFQNSQILENKFSLFPNSENKIEIKNLKDEKISEIKNLEITSYHNKNRSCPLPNINKLSNLDLYYDLIQYLDNFIKMKLEKIILDSDIKNLKIFDNWYLSLVDIKIENLLKFQREFLLYIYISYYLNLENLINSPNQKTLPVFRCENIFHQDYNKDQIFYQAENFDVYLNFIKKLLDELDDLKFYNFLKNEFSSQKGVKNNTSTSQNKFEIFNIDKFFFRNFILVRGRLIKKIKKVPKEVKNFNLENEIINTGVKSYFISKSQFSQFSNFSEIKEVPGLLDILLSSLSIGEEVTIENYLHYLIYFKYSEILNLTKKFLFLKRIINLTQMVPSFSVKNLIHLQTMINLDMSTYQILKLEGVLGICSTNQKKIKKIQNVYENLVEIFS
jgi:hypothetical protein